MDELYELALKRRSIRKFKNESLSVDVIDKIMNIALTAPSSWGAHPVHFIVVKNKEKIKQIARCKAMGATPLLTASVCIVVMVDTSNCELWIEDASVASTYILLAAEHYGVGACWIHIRNREGQHKSADEEIRNLLNVPDKYRVLNVVALGLKDENKKAHTEEEFSQNNIHKEFYNN